MTWSTPPTFAPATMVTSTQLNIISADLLESSTAKATASGNYSVSSGPFAIVERVIGFDSVATSESTTNTAYVNLATAGPQVTVTSGIRCIGMHSSYLESSSVNATALTSLDISGATTVSPTDNLSLSMTSSTTGAHLRASYVCVYSMTSGSNVFKMMYRSSSGASTAQFMFRRLTVLPF